MPFNLSEEQLAQTESALGARLPNSYRDAMQQNNGGEAFTGEDDWMFYPIKDTSDRKRLARTCNHILHETEVCKGFGRFPTHALAIAGNGLGDQMVLIHESGRWSEQVFVWRHESGDLQVLAQCFSDLQKQ